MNEIVLERLRREFGPPASEADSVLCWPLSSVFDLMAERGPAEHGVMWIPWNPNRGYLGFGEVYTPGKQRNSETLNADYPSLGPTSTVLCLRIRWPIELEVAVSEVRALAIPRGLPG